MTRAKNGQNLRPDVRHSRSRCWRGTIQAHEGSMRAGRGESGSPGAAVNSELADRFDNCGDAKMALFDCIEVFYC